MKTNETRTDDAVQQGGASVANPNANESLSDLAGEAAATVDAGAGAAPGAPVASEVVDEATAKDIADLLKLARDMAAPMVEAMGYLKPGQTREIWTDAALLAIAEPTLEIMRRWGLDLGDALGRMGPYIGLFVGLSGPSMATWAAIRVNAAALENDGQQQ